VLVGENGLAIHNSVEIILVESGRPIHICTSADKNFCGNIRYFEVRLFPCGSDGRIETHA